MSAPNALQYGNPCSWARLIAASAAQLMDHGSETQGKTQAEGVPNLVHQRPCFVALHQPLLRIAKRPQRQGGIGMAPYAIILPREERRGVVLLGIVKRYTLRKVGVR